MRPLYLFLKFLLRITLWIYYPRFKTINSSPRRYNSTIYMSNHAASFMDPLVIAGPQKSIVFFMTRADIYKGIMKQIFWAANMLPIYRQQDGGNIKKQNQKVFRNTSSLLKRGRNILIFAEGFTDNEFVRSLKPVKRGAVKMGFAALEEIEWKKKIYIQPVGINYTDRNHLGSACIISNGEPLCLNNYKEEYLKNPHDIIHDLTSRMEIEMREQITDVRNEELTSFHENIMRITRKGMNELDSDKSIPLFDRLDYSKRLASWMNETDVEDSPELLGLKKALENYFSSLEDAGIEELPFYKILSNKRRKMLDVFYLIMLFPIVVFAHVFTYFPVKWIKGFVEKSFKRHVFWSSVKMLVGAGAVGVYNLILLFLISKIFSISYLLLLGIGLLVVPVSFVMMRNWKNKLHLHRQMDKIEKGDFGNLAKEREKLSEEIKRLIPCA